MRAQISEIRRVYGAAPVRSGVPFAASKMLSAPLTRIPSSAFSGGSLPMWCRRRDREVPVALAANVKAGPAEILTVLDGERVESFAVEIIKVNA